MFLEGTSSAPQFWLSGGGGFPKFAFLDSDKVVVNINSNQDKKFAALVQQELQPTVESALGLGASSTPYSGGLLKEGKLKGNNGNDRWDPTLQFSRSRGFQIVDEDSGQCIDPQAFEPTKYCWTGILFNLRSVMLSEKYPGTVIYNKEISRVRVRAGSATSVPRTLVSVRSVTRGMFGFGEPRRDLKPGLTFVPARNGSGEIVQLRFDAGGEIPPFPISDPASSMYANAQDPEYTIQFQVGDAEERKAADDLSSYLEEEAVARKDSWISTGNSTHKLDAVIRSKVRSLLKASDKYPDMHPLFKCKLRTANAARVCVDTNGEPVPVEHLPRMRYKEAHVEIGTVFVNSSIIDFTRKLVKLVVYPSC